MRPLVVLCVLAAVAACVRPPQNLAGRFDEISVAEAQEKPREGVAVRWGGTLVGTRPERERTCFEIVSRPLDRRARPVVSDETGGRFIACVRGFYDPMVYVPGRDVTVVGVLNGTVSRRVGGYDYTFPRVVATTVYLWPERAVEAPYPPFSISIGGGVGGVVH